MRVVGIDLGTTNSVVAFVDENGEAHAIADDAGSRITPSVVYFPADRPDAIEIGALAAKQAVIAPARVARLFKRGMGAETFLPGGARFEVDGTEFRPEVLSSMVVKKLVEIAEGHLSESISDVVITVPAYFGDAERSATQLAGEIAGLNVHLLPAEPMAAAVAHGLDGSQGAKCVLVFDLGGGTFDVTILRRSEAGELNAIAHEGDRELGGADFDKVIVDRIAAQAASEAGADLYADPQDLAGAFETAEELKKELSTRDKAGAVVLAGGRRLQVELTRDDFEAMIATPLQDTELTVERALDAADMTRADIDEVLMVGGSSRIPAFQAMLKQYFGKDPILTKNLDEDVARGAALMGTLKLGLAPEESPLARLPAPNDVSSHGIGIEALNDQGQSENVVLIPAQSRIPVIPPVSHRFATASDNQTQILVVIHEGDEQDLRFVQELGRGEGTFSQPRPLGHPIDVEMSLDESGRVQVVARDGATQALLCEVEVFRKGGLSEAEQNAATAMVSDYEVF